MHRRTWNTERFDLGFEPGSCHWQARALTTALQCSPLIYFTVLSLNQKHKHIPCMTFILTGRLLAVIFTPAVLFVRMSKTLDNENHLNFLEELVCRKWLCIFFMHAKKSIWPLCTFIFSFTLMSHKKNQDHRTSLRSYLLV